MKLPSTTDIFVYGTLKPAEANYKFYCQGKTLSEISAYTLGDLYALPIGYPAMTLGNNKVSGFVLSFDDSSILDALDLLEGYQPQQALAFNEYYRLRVPVYCLEENAIAQAWAYFMTPKKVMQYQGIKVPSGYWTSRTRC